MNFRSMLDRKMWFYILNLTAKLVAGILQILQVYLLWHKMTMVHPHFFVFVFNKHTNKPRVAW